MSRAVIRDGKWVTEEGTPLLPWELNKVHHQIERINEFAKGVTTLTHEKIEILTHILHATPEQERAILKILTMKEAAINSLM